MGGGQELRGLVDELEERGELPVEAYARLIEGAGPELAAYARQRADAVRRRVWGTEVLTRGLIEVSSFCANDCLYCGIRRSNASAARYRLTPEEVAACAGTGYELGYRTFVIQGGEDPWFTDERLCAIVESIKRAHPDCAVTLSMGERPRASYRRLFEAGAERYLLRHESASPRHYALLHPAQMSLERRLECLDELREAGFAVGCGFMVGSPYQTARDLALDLKLVEAFRPEMCGIGPFIPHHATPFAGRPAGSLELTCLLLSLLRLMQPELLLPATTALGSLHPRGREMGIEAGANVVMPNLSPAGVRKSYELYDNKICTGEEAAECRGCLGLRMLSIGFTLAVDRGDPPPAACPERRLGAVQAVFGGRHRANSPSPQPAAAR